MPVVWIPALLLPLSGGRQKVNLPGSTVRQVIENLEAQFPGTRERLLDGDRLRPSIAVVVDGVISQEKLRHKLEDGSEVHFMPAISGGNIHLNQQFRTPSGRLLGYDEYGPADGKPLFYLHGAPSSRMEFRLFGSDDLLRSLNVRLIAVDRPGMGLSDFQPDRRLLDFPNDLLALADDLHIERFAVLAFSLGGPSGLACAYAIPERLTKVGIVSGAAVYTHAELMQNINAGTRRYLNLPRENPLASRLFLRMMGAMARFAPKLMIANAVSLLPPPDAASVSDPEIQKGFIDMVREAFRQGTGGAFHESLLAVSDWGFKPQDIQMPVLLWHGEMDQNIPAAMARYIAKTIPHCESHFYPNEGHLSLFKNNLTEIVHKLAQ